MSDKNPVLDDFARAVANLKEVMKMDKDPVRRDAAVKRFELCFDLAWKALKVRAKKEGLECYSPRGCFKTAFQLKLIDYDEKWLAMLKDRNLTAHVYRDEIAEDVFGRLGGYLDLFRKLAERLRETDD